MKRSFRLPSGRVATISLVSLLAALLGAWSLATGHQLARANKPLYRYVVHSEMKGPYDGREMIGWLTRQGFDVAGFNWRKSEIEVITDEAGIAQLKSNNITGEILSTHLFGVSPFSLDTRYLDSKRVEDLLKSLNQQYPQLTRLEQIGTSLEGRAIWALLISTTPGLNDPTSLEKPSIIFDGLHHAREIMTPEIVADVAQTALVALSTKPTEPLAKNLANWNVWVVPMINVDGNNIVWTSDALWRKNAHSDGSNVYGVDINRNYPYRFAGCSGSSSDPDDQDYHGESGGSEPETKAIMKLADEVLPTASLSYHSYSELVIYPFGCSGELTGENALLKKIGYELASVLPSDSGSGNYTPGTPWQILYGVDGDSMDYLFTEFGTTAFTFEVNQAFQPAYEMREPTLVKHRKAWQYFMNRIDSNLLRVQVKDAKTGSPIVANVDVSTIEHKFGEKPFRTNTAGDFFKVLDPGTYSLRFTTADGRSVTTALTMSGSQSITVTVP